MAMFLITFLTTYSTAVVSRLAEAVERAPSCR
jgi:hypothetical protein